MASQPPTSTPTTNASSTKKIVTQRITKPGKSRFTPSLSNRAKPPNKEEPSKAVQQQQNAVATDTPAIPIAVGTTTTTTTTDITSTFTTNTSTVPTAEVTPIQQPIEIPQTMSKQQTIAVRKPSHTTSTAITTPTLRRRAGTGAEKKIVSVSTTTNNTNTTTKSPHPSSQIIMKHFLRDNGEGIPMQSSSPPKRNKRKKALNNDNTAAAANPNQMMLESSKNSSISTSISPRVRIGADGEIVMDDNVSIDNGGDGQNHPHHYSNNNNNQSVINMNVIHEGGQSGRHLTSHAFVKGMDSNRWNASQTEEFYTALSVCGTDFTLLSLMIKDKRSREQIKGKFKVEERKNPARVSLALKNRRTMTVDMFEVNGYYSNGKHNSNNNGNCNKFGGSNGNVSGNKDDKVVDDVQERRPGRPKQEEVGLLSAVTSSSLSGSPRKKKCVDAGVGNGDGGTSSPLASPIRSIKRTAEKIVVEKGQKENQSKTELFFGEENKTESSSTAPSAKSPVKRKSLRKKN